jgi:hypothetical protein
METEMKELDIHEVENVSGGSLYGDVAYAVGKFIGAVVANSREIDSMDNPMLGAMQYGAQARRMGYGYSFGAGCR